MREVNTILNRIEEVKMDLKKINNIKVKAIPQEEEEDISKDS